MWTYLSRSLGHLHLSNETQYMSDHIKHQNGQKNDFNDLGMAALLLYEGQCEDFRKTSWESFFFFYSSLRMVQK